MDRKDKGIIGRRMVLSHMNTLGYDGHVAEVLKPPSIMEPRVTVRISGTQKSIKVRPECCTAVVQRRTKMDIQDGLSGWFVIWALEKASPETFIPEVVGHVLEHLRIQNVDVKEVTVAGVSSEAESHAHSIYTYKAECTLEPGTNSCWISREGSQRPDWITYKLGPQKRRVDYVLMAIPVMPHGPLSVRSFHLEWSDMPDGPWESDQRHKFKTLDEDGLQEFAVVPPIEANFVRAVFTENAAEGSSLFAASLSTQMPIQSVGCWQISFS